MVTDLQREEDQTAMLKKALAEAHEAEQEAHTTADVARAAEQHAMKELGRMVEIQVTLTDQLENATRKLEAEEAQTRLLRAAISAADHDRQNENNVHSDTVTALRCELASAVTQQQELLDQLVEKDEQVRYRGCNVCTHVQSGDGRVETQVLCSWQQACKHLHHKQL